MISKATTSSMIFAGGLAALSVGVGILGVSAIKNASNVENLRASLDILTGSAENGEKMFKQIYDFAAKTPFETTELTQAASTMMGFGISAEEVMPNLKMLGDISLGNKEKLSGLSLAFSQVQSTGRLMGQDLLQMINQGFNPLTIISQKTGKSMAELKKDMERGAISADMVRDAMVTATSAGGRFYKGMEIGSQTLSGVWSTLMDNTKSLIRGFIGLDETGKAVEGGFFERVKNAVKGLSGFIEKNKEAINKWVKGLMNGLVDNMPIIVGAIVGGLIPAIIALGVALATNPLTWIILAFAALGAIINIVVQRLGGWGVVWNAIMPYLSTFWTWVQTKIVPALNEFWGWVQARLIPALISFWNVASTVIIPALKLLWTEFKKMIVVVMEFWVQNKDWLMPVLKAVAVVIGVIFVTSILVLVGAFRFIIAVIQIVISVIDFLADSVKRTVNAWSWAINTIVGIFNWWRGVCIGIGQSVVDWFSSIPGSIANALGGVYGAITGAFNKAFNWLGEKVDWVKSQLQKINPFARFSPSLVDNVTKGTLVIKRKYDDMFDNIGQSAQIRSTLQAGLVGSQSTSTQTTTANFTGNIYLGDSNAVNSFFDRLSRNQELAQKGLSTI